MEKNVYELGGKRQVMQDLSLLRTDYTRKSQLDTSVPL